MFCTLKRYAKVALPLRMIGFLRPIWNWFRSKWLRVRLWRYQVVDYLQKVKIQSVISARIRKIRHLNRPIKVGFFVQYDASFTLRKVFSLLCEEKDFDPQIVIIPDSLRGEKYMFETAERAFHTLSNEYGGRVVNSWDGTKWCDLAPQFDVCFISNPYDGQTMSQYTITYNGKRGVPVFFAKYFYDCGTVADRVFYKQQGFSFLWRFYFDRRCDVGQLYSAHWPLRIFNRVRVVGAPQTDAMADFVPKDRSRKLIVLAPHQSVVEDGLLHIGNFNDYVELFLRLPKMYPHVDWVFRPHPLLFRRMVMAGYWTDSIKDEFLRKLTSFANVRYENGGSYYETMMNSDAMIEDSGSFIGEYYYTGKPHCYVLHSEERMRRNFLPWGQTLLSHLYKAYSEQDIINFIDNVVLAGNDPMKEEREKFAKEKLMYNYPHASEAIVADIKKALGRA